LSGLRKRRRGEVVQLGKGGAEREEISSPLSILIWRGAHCGAKKTKKRWEEKYTHRIEKKL